MKNYTDTEVLDSRLVTITPQVASEMICANEGNRKLKESTVKNYASQMARGSWKETGDVIRVSETGNLLDGQHRLHAIVRSGVSFRFNVTTLRFTGEQSGTESAVGIPIDIGNKRSTDVILGELKENVATARVLIKVADGLSSGGDNEIIGKYIDCFRRSMEVVNRASINRVRVVGHSAVKAAVIARHAMGLDYTAELHSISLDRFNEVSPLWMSWYRKVLGLADTGGKARESIFVHTWALTDPEKQAARISVLSIRGNAGYQKYFDDARYQISEILNDSTKELA